MSGTIHKKFQCRENALAEATLPDGALVTVVSTDSCGKAPLSPAEEAELLAAIAEADAGHTIPAEEVLRRLPGR